VKHSTHSEWNVSTRHIGRSYNFSLTTVNSFAYTFASHAWAALPLSAVTMGSSIGCGGSIRGAPTDAGREQDVSLSALEAGFESGDAAREGEAGSTEGGPETPDGAFCAVEPSNYDESCSTDSDCAPADFGDYCGHICQCGPNAIGRASLAQDKADMARTPFGSGAFLGIGCSCAGVGLPGPCCRQGHCIGKQAAVTPDAGVSCAADFGAAGSSPWPAADAAPPGSVWCSAQYGPSDAATPGAVPGGWGPGACSHYNDEWACCTPLGVGVLCIPYLDAGATTD
jgi:hypothetical protein